MIIRTDIQNMPKIDLHRHFEGAIRPETLYQFYLEKEETPILSQEDFIQGLQAQLEDKSFKLFIDKLATKYIKQLGLNVKQIKQLASEVIEDAAADNILYLEVRVCPLAHQREDLSAEQFLDAFLTGIKKGSQQTGLKAGVIISFKREDSLEENMELAKLIKDYQHRGIVGVDLCGDEAKYVNESFVKLFEYCRKAGLQVTIHAGELDGWPSIASAVKVLGATRVGHAVNIFPEANQVVKLLRDSDVVVEMCPQSNLFTGAVDNLESHPINYLLERDVLVTVGTDDPIATNTTLTDELFALYEAFDLSLFDFRRMQLAAIGGSFLSIEEKELIQFKFIKQFDNFLKRRHFFESDHALVLVLIASLLKEHQIEWSLVGSTSIALQGVRNDVGDIDILVNRDDVGVVNGILRSCAHSVMRWKRKHYYSSIFGCFEIHGIQIDVMADFTVESDSGDKLKYNLNDPDKKEIFCKWTKIPVLPKEYEIVRHFITNRTDKLNFIGKYLRRSKIAQERLVDFMNKRGFGHLIAGMKETFQF